MPKSWRLAVVCSADGDAARNVVCEASVNDSNAIVDTVVDFLYCEDILHM